MATQYSYYQPNYQTAPMAVPAKPQYESYYPQYSQQGYSVSPPEVADSTSSGSGMTASYGHSGYSVASRFVTFFSFPFPQQKQVLETRE